MIKCVYILLLPGAGRIEKRNPEHNHDGEDDDHDVHVYVDDDDEHPESFLCMLSHWATVFHNGQGNVSP